MANNDQAASTSATGGTGPKLQWLDEQTQAPVIDRLARQLDSFIETMADGRVDEKELASQENRVVELIKEVEPQLSGTLHAKVSDLLCELTAYTIMQVLYSMEQAYMQRDISRLRL